MAPTGTIPSPDLIWLCIRKGNSYTVKRPGAGKVFSKERGNLSNVHSYAASGLANKNVVHIAPSPAGRGVTISKRKEGASVFENKSAVEKKSVKGNTSFRKTAGAITQVNKSEGGRPDLQKIALARGSQILKSQTNTPKAPRVRAARGKKSSRSSEDSEEGVEALD